MNLIGHVGSSLSVVPCTLCREPNQREDTRNVLNTQPYQYQQIKLPYQLNYHNYVSGKKKKRRDTVEMRCCHIKDHNILYILFFFFFCYKSCLAGIQGTGHEHRFPLISETDISSSLKLSFSPNTAFTTLSAVLLS